MTLDPQEEGLHLNKEKIEVTVYVDFPLSGNPAELAIFDLGGRRRVSFDAEVKEDCRQFVFARVWLEGVGVKPGRYALGVREPGGPWHYAPIAVD